MSTSSRRALVVGAGIGGLAAGLALRHASWDIQIFERAKSPRELGFALLLAPNAMSALRELGLKDEVLAGGVVTRRGEIRRPNGDVLRRLNASTTSAHLGEETVAVLRPLLHGALLNTVGTGVLALGSELVGFRQHAAGVEIALADGRRVSGRILIGADGVGSMVRKQLHPEERAPRPSGLCALRGMADGVVRLARRNARFGSLQSRPACWLRDLMVRLVPEAVLLRSLIALGLPQDELDP